MQKQSSSDTSFRVLINEPLRQLWQTSKIMWSVSGSASGRVDAGTTPAATNSQWVFHISVGVTLSSSSSSSSSSLWWRLRRGGWGGGTMCMKCASGSCMWQWVLDLNAPGHHRCMYWPEVTSRNLHIAKRVREQEVGGDRGVVGAQPVAVDHAVMWFAAMEQYWKSGREDTVCTLEVFRWAGEHTMKSFAIPSIPALQCGWLNRAIPTTFRETGPLFINAMQALGRECAMLECPFSHPTNKVLSPRYVNGCLAS
jgi:hypothetical protein